MKSNLFIILSKLLTNHDIHIKKKELRLQLLSHPSFPSLYSLIDTLNHYGVENLALTLPVNEKTIEALPSSFIIHHKSLNDLVLVEKQKEEFSIIFDDKTTTLLSYESFKQEWEGVLLMVEKNDTVQENVDDTNYFQLLNYLLLGVLLTFFIYSNYSLFGLTHFLLSLIGLTFSIFIFKTEIGIPSFGADRICNFGKDKNCESVLKSEGASLFGILKLSDLCLLAFGTYTLTWFFYFLIGVTQFMSIICMSLTAVMFSVYSLWYQYIVLKKWCPLCLGIVAVLCLQSATVLLAESSAFIFGIESISILLLSFLISLGVGSYLLPSLKRKNILEKKEIEFYKLKRDFSVFQIFYNKSKSIDVKKKISGEIILGKKNADLSIVLVTNPLCTFCKEVHKDIMTVLNRYPDKIKVNIRFYINTKNEKRKDYQIASELLRIYDTCEMETLVHALDLVYGKQKNVLKSLRQMRGTKSNVAYDEILDEQYDWCEDNAIDFTPNLILNGKQYPVEFESNDISYFIDDLTESTKRI